MPPTHFRPLLAGAGFAATVLLAPSEPVAFDFTPGHIYATPGFVAKSVTQYDANGDFVDVLNLNADFQAPNREFRGLAFGPDGLLYVAQNRDPGNGFRVIALDEAGNVQKVFEHPSVISNNAGFGKIAFDDVGRFYVGGNSGIVRFEIDDEDSGQLFYDQSSIIDVEVLPDGNVLAIPGMTSSSSTRRVPSCATFRSPTRTALPATDCSSSAHLTGWSTTRWRTRSSSPWVASPGSCTGS